MKTAVELDVLTAIAKCNTGPPGDSGALQSRRARRAHSVRFLTIHGFLTKENGKYGLAPDTAAFLNRHSPAYLGGPTEFLLTTRVRRGHELLTEAVRGGGTAPGRGTLEPENPDWVKFARAMMPLMSYPAEVMATELRKDGEARKVLDIAAGHGMFGIRWQDKIHRRTYTRQIGETFWK